MSVTNRHFRIHVVHRYAVDTAAEIRQMLALTDAELEARARASILLPVREDVLSVEFSAPTIAELRNKVVGIAELFGVSSKAA